MISIPVSAYLFDKSDNICRLAYFDSRTSTIMPHMMPYYVGSLMEWQLCLKFSFCEAIAQFLQQREYLSVASIDYIVRNVKRIDTMFVNKNQLDEVFLFTGVIIVISDKIDGSGDTMLKELPDDNISSRKLDFVTIFNSDLFFRGIINTPAKYDKNLNMIVPDKRKILCSSTDKLKSLCINSVIGACTQYVKQNFDSNVADKILDKLNLNQKYKGKLLVCRNLQEIFSIKKLRHAAVLAQNTHDDDCTKGIKVTTFAGHSKGFDNIEQLEYCILGAPVVKFSEGWCMVFKGVYTVIDGEYLSRNSSFVNKFVNGVPTFVFWQDGAEYADHIEFSGPAITIKDVCSGDMYKFFGGMDQLRYFMSHRRGIYEFYMVCPFSHKVYCVNDFCNFCSLAKKIGGYLIAYECDKSRNFNSIFDCKSHMLCVPNNAKKSDFWGKEGNYVNEEYKFSNIMKIPFYSIFEFLPKLSFPTGLVDKRGLFKTRVRFNVDEETGVLSVFGIFAKGKDSFVKYFRRKYFLELITSSVKQTVSDYYDYKYCELANKFWTATQQYIRSVAEYNSCLDCWLDQKKLEDILATAEYVAQIRLEVHGVISDIMNMVDSLSCDHRKFVLDVNDKLSNWLVFIENDKIFCGGNVKEVVKTTYKDILQFRGHIAEKVALLNVPTTKEYAYKKHDKTGDISIS